ncbi:MAG: glycosyltransferase [Bacillota bacterium]
MSEKRCDLTIAMIVKNEIKYLERCLQALQPLRDAIDCQLVITDTGSTDGTIEIAKKYADDYLEFEWIKDFAAARNTGVEAARGKWFLYIDADQIADESILAIADFIKSSDRDTYNYAAFSEINYADENGTIDNYFYPKRLYNMTKKKSYFSGAVHETLSFHGENCIIDAWFHHYGHMASVISGKGERNQEILDEILKREPLNMKAHRENVVNQKNVFFRVELAEKALQLIEEHKLKVTETIFLKIDLCKHYPRIDRFIDFEKTVQSFEKKKTLPTLELLYVAGTAYKNHGDEEKSIEIFSEYLTLFLHLEKNPDLRFLSLGVYEHNIKKYFFDKSIYVANYYFEQKDYETLKEILSQMEIETAKELFDDTKILASYCLLAIQCGAIDLLSKLYKAVNQNGEEKNIDELLDIFNDLYFYISKEEQTEFHNAFAGADNVFMALNELRSQEYDFSKCTENAMKVLSEEANLYDNLMYSDVFYATILSQKDPFAFYEKSTMEHLKSIIENLIFHRKDVIDTIYDKLKNQTDGFVPQNNLSQIMIYGEVYFDCFVRQATLNNEAEVLDKEMLEKLNLFFEAYIKTMTVYVEKIYSKNILSEGNFNALETIHSVAYIMKDTIITKKQNPSAYISALKSAVAIAPELLVSMEQLAKLLEIELNEANTELDALARQIKQMLQTLIQQGDKANAIEIFKKYKEIAPNDMDLLQLQRAIENM